MGYDPRTMSGLVIAVGSRFRYTLNNSTFPPSTVAELIDYSGNASNTMAQTTKLKQPQWITSKSPYPGIYFDGDTNTTNSDWIECASNTNIAVADTMTCFLIADASQGQLGSFRRMVSKWDDTGSQGWQISTDANLNAPTGARLLVNNTATSFNGGAVFLSSGKVLLTAVINNGVTATYLNGGSATAGTYVIGSGVGNTKPLTIGARDNGAAAFRGDFYEYIQYNRVLSQTEIDTVRTGLNGTWSIY